MRIHYLQHAPFEDPGYILSWAGNLSHSVTSTEFYKDPTLPHSDDFDFLVIMGGPMNIYEYSSYPWLKEEKSFIKNAISRDKKVLGICLGAQLLANALDARVFRNKYTEIGWFPVTRTIESDTTFFKHLPRQFTTFHWHGDTFDIPQGSIPLAESEACRNQAFLYNDNVLALQFHPESTEKTINEITEHCSEEITDEEYIQDLKGIIDESKHHILKNNAIMDQILNLLTS